MKSSGTQSIEMDRDPAYAAGSGPLSLPLSPEVVRGKRVLHVGSGRRKILGAVTLDIDPRYEPDVVWDLNDFPYPFSSDSFDIVVCEHVIEHLNHIVSVMEELHRVTRAGGQVWIRVPHHSSLNANTDPTHTRRFSAFSMDYFCVGTELSSYDYTPVRFRKLVGRMTMRPLKPFDRFLMNLINRHIRFYEEHLSYILPGQELLFILEVLK